MPIGPDTDRQGSGRGNRDLHWEETSGAGEYGQGGGAEYRHQGKDFEYLVRHEPEAEGHGADNPWVAAIFDDSGRYSPVSGRLPTLADAKSMAAAYHANEWQPGTEKDLQNPNNPDYAHRRGNPEQLREDQARMQEMKGYVAEGTEGLWGNIKAAVTGNKPKPEYDWDAPTELDRSAKDQQYKDNPDVLSGEHGKAGGSDPLGWQSPKDKAQFRAQNELKGSLDPLAPDDDASRAIKGMRTPTETSKPRWDEQKKKSQDEYEAGAHKREFPHLYPNPLDPKPEPPW